jgi:hypothetical protein
MFVCDGGFSRPSFRAPLIDTFYLSRYRARAWRPPILAVAGGRAISGFIIIGVTEGDHQMLQSRHLGLVIPFVVVICSQTANSAEPAAKDAAPVPQMAFKTIERTVMMPTWVTEHRVVNVCKYRTEERQTTCTVCRPVPETHTIECEITVPTYETHMRTVQCTVCKPVMTTEQREVTVMVPTQEKRQGTRVVCRMVPVTEKRTICECQCGEMVKREVECTVMRPKSEEVPYEFTYTSYHPENRTVPVQICNFAYETQAREVPYTVCIPQQKKITRQIVTCRLVSEERTFTQTVNIPYTEQQEMDVQVCKMMPKTITCQVPACWCP